MVNSGHVQAVDDADVASRSRRMNINVMSKHSEVEVLCAEVRSGRRAASHGPRAVNHAPWPDIEKSARRRRRHGMALCGELRRGDHIIFIECSALFNIPSMSLV